MDLDYLERGGGCFSDKEGVTACEQLFPSASMLILRACKPRLTAALRNSPSFPTQQEKPPTSWSFCRNRKAFTCTFCYSLSVHQVESCPLLQLRPLRRLQRRSSQRSRVPEPQQWLRGRRAEAGAHIQADSDHVSLSEAESAVCTRSLPHVCRMSATDKASQH